MPVAKELVAQKLKDVKKTSGYNVSDKLIDSLADDYAGAFETEEELTAFLESPAAKATLKAAAAEADRARTQAAQTAKKPAEPPKDVPSDPATKTDDTPEWAKRLEARLDKFEQGQAQKTLAERFRSDDRLKNLPEEFFEGRYPTTEEEFDQKADRMADVFKDYGQFRNAQEGSKGSGTPATPPTGSVKQPAKASDAQRSQLLKSLGVQSPLTANPS